MNNISLYYNSEHKGTKKQSFKKDKRWKLKTSCLCVPNYSGINMNKNKFSPKDDEELMQIIAQYEEMRKKEKTLYLDADQYADIIDYYMTEGQMDEAHKAAESGLNIHPGNTFILVMLATLYLDEGRFDESRQIIDSIKESQSVDIQMLRVELLLREEKTDEALTLIEKLNIDDEDTLTMLDVVYLCMDYGIPEASGNWLEKAYKADPTNEEVLSTMGEYYLGQEQYEDAIRIYNALIDKHPYSSEYWTKLAKVYFNLFLYDKTIEAADFAIVSDENNGEAHCLRGNAFNQLENYQTAIEEYETASKLNYLAPEFASMLIAFCYMSLEEWDNGYKHLKQAIDNVVDEDSPLIIDLTLHSVRCLYKMNRNKEAHNYCEAILKRFPDTVDIILWNGKIYHEEKDEEKAMQQWDRALGIAPYADTWNSIGMSYLNQRDIESAKRFFLRAEELEPENQDTRKYLAYIYLFLGDEEKFTPYKEDFITYLLERSNPANYSTDFSTEVEKELYLETKALLDELYKNGEFDFPFPQKS